MPRHNSVRLSYQRLGAPAGIGDCYNFITMCELLRLLLLLLLAALRTRRSLMLENLALRQQLAVFKRKHPRTRIGPHDKLFWIAAIRFWSGWKETLFLVQPETASRWHKAGFRFYWTMLCKARKRVGGGPRTSKEIRELIFQMVAENPTWGAPHIHGELLMLGFDVSETTISRWMRRAPKNPELAKRWLTFLRNHREAIAAMDFFTVPTLTFNVLYCFFVISHDRRTVLRFNVTRAPNALWIVQQLRETWPYASAHRFLIFDRDSKFGNAVVHAARDMSSEPVRTAFRSPWQNGVAERWVGSIRRDLLDHVIVLNQRHLKRLMDEYVRYYHEDRTHLGLAKDTPAGRPVSIPASDGNRIQSQPRLGGLHQRYDLAV